jgi:CheY-like chemotaxis protein
MKNISILIVEDEININEVVKSYLDKEGYITHQSFDGKSALENFDKHNQDIILLDIMLPDILGTEICKEIRKNHTLHIKPDPPKPPQSIIKTSLYNSSFLTTLYVDIMENL